MAQRKSHQDEWLRDSTLGSLCPWSTLWVSPALKLQEYLMLPPKEKSPRSYRQDADVNKTNASEFGQFKFSPTRRYCLRGSPPLGSGRSVRKPAHVVFADQWRWGGLQRAGISMITPRPARRRLEASHIFWLGTWRTWYYLVHVL